ncbi:hypothetical protein KAT51_07245 [bacterium]|nr:hypothetical protein [bacterium]
MKFKSHRNTVKKLKIRRPRGLKNGVGFTILEAMIALVLLAFGILALLRVMPVALKASKRAEETTIATILAQQKLEEWRACNPDPSTLCAGNLETTGEFDEKYEWELSTITYVTDVCNSSVSVWYPADQGSPGDREKQRVVNLTTYMFIFPIEIVT